MAKDQERDDTCAGIYRKSLLYLIRLRSRRTTTGQILGLEVSLRRNRALARLLRPRGPVAGAAEWFFSPSVATDGAQPRGRRRTAASTTTRRR